MADDNGGAAARGPVIHRTHLFGGRQTAAEVHASHVWRGKRCQGCRSPKVAVEIRVSFLVKDLPSSIASAMALDNAAGLTNIQPFQTPQGPAVRWATVYACQGCRSTAERVTARTMPSYALIYIDSGPDPDRPIVAVPR